MDQSSGDDAARRTNAGGASVNDVVDGVISYAKSQTLGPLRGAGRWLAFGAAGAVMSGLGAILVLLGVLRLVQTEWSTVSGPDSGWSWIPYLIVLVVGGALVAVTVSRINRSYLDRPSTGEDR